MRRLLHDVLIAGLLFLLPLLMFWPQTVGGRTLIPADNLYQFQPYATYREQVGAPDTPHNHLLSDLVLQNYQWKTFIRDSIAQREVPLWNPHQFAGIPFMAAGQQSTLYPLSALYYVLPLPAAYGWFTVVNLWLAGLFMYALLRGLGVSRFGGALAGITYQLSGFFIASAVHPMIIGAVVWLPLLVLMAEFIVRRQSLLGRRTSTPWVVVGAVALAASIFAGHVEITIYTLLILAYYSGVRLLWQGWQERADGLRHTFKAAGWIAAMVALGFALAAIQFVPLFEFASSNWRAERSDLATVLGYAHPFRDLLQYVLPNFYGSPAHHHYFDVFAWERLPVSFVNSVGELRTHTEWGIKNYVEGALYVGILPLALAALAIFDMRRRESAPASPPYRLIVVVLAGLALTFTFGLPTYALIYYLPGINQLNTAFRWVFGVTFAVAVLAGFGADVLLRRPRAAHWTGLGLLAAGGLALAGLLLTRALFDSFEPLLTPVFETLARAGEGLADARMFYSYQFGNVLIFGVVASLAGVAVLLASRGERARRWRGVPLWQVGAVAVLAADLLIASWGFNTAADPRLLDFEPPAVTWLRERQQQEEPFRYITLDAPAQGLDNLLPANATLRYGLDDVRGYDSIISRQYVDYMRQVQPQTALDFNRIAPLYLDRIAAGEVDWERLDLLNVRYVVSHPQIELPPELDGRLVPVYEDEATRIYENTQAAPRAFISAGGADAGLPDISISTDLARVIADSGREKLIEINGLGQMPDEWLIYSETYAPGWRAFIRPQGLGLGGEVAAERPLQAELVLENFIGVRLHGDEPLADRWADDELSPAQLAALADGHYVVRLVYSPLTFQVGLFASVIGAALLVFLVGVWLWRVLVGTADSEGTTVSRVARNSAVPIVLNLFNRGIDFAFALVMLRILGPEDAGIYYYAIVVFVWFDIFTNFGLDVWLIREASQQRPKAGYFFLNTSALRLLLMVAGVPLVIGFVLVRQAFVDPPLAQTALVALGLLYIGLVPGSISKGMTSLFYAFEKAEYPAAVATITTINKAVFGVVVLLLGYGIVGLAAVSILTNFITLAILVWTGRALIGRLRLRPPSRKLVGGMVDESWPLMLNHFLATIFFQIDVIILEALRGARIVGQYSVSYRWLLAINIVPAFFTQALLPVMSRQAKEDRQALKRTYTLGVKLLLAIAMPLAVLFTFLAESLTLLLGGAEFLPAGAVALQIMIWSIPFGWINSLTQYTLIAVDLQRRITLAFVLAVTFNIATNLIFIPIYGYRAAAVTTIFSEMVLLVPFGLLLQSALGRLDWLDMVWRQVIAGAAMLALMAVSWPLSPVLALPAGGIVYGGVLLALRPLSAAERHMLLPLLPGRLRRLAPPA